MTNFSFNEKVAILSLASGIMFADNKARMTERSSFEKIQKKLDQTIPVSLLTGRNAHTFHSVLWIVCVHAAAPIRYIGAYFFLSIYIGNEVPKTIRDCG